MYGLLTGKVSIGRDEPTNRSASFLMKYNIGSIAERLCESLTNFSGENDYSSMTTVASSTAWMVQRGSLVHGCLIAAQTSTHNSPWSISIYLSSLMHDSILKQSCGMQSWPLRCCDEYIPSTRLRNLDKDSLDAMSNMRYINIRCC